MSLIKDFLESSTIHGLLYISSSKKISKVFWILVVLSGFSIASYLIHQAFDNWEQDPIKTTIETIPIKEIKLPNLTVCPPKESFTNLNYDIRRLENVTLNATNRGKLNHYAVYEILDSFFQMNKKNLGTYIVYKYLTSVFKNYY